MCRVLMARNFHCTFIGRHFYAGFINCIIETESVSEVLLKTNVLVKDGELKWMNPIISKRFIYLFIYFCNMLFR